METQAALAIPLEDNRMRANPSNQSPAECHQTCADALAVEANRLEVEIRQQTETAARFLQAYSERLNLTISFNAIKIPGGEEALPVGTFKTREEQPDMPDYPVLDFDSEPFSYPTNPSAPDKFAGFTYSAACCEVEIDVLTGEVKTISSTLVYDIGLSINPSIDVGQIEGAFMMGVGTVTRLVPIMAKSARSILGGTSPPGTTTVPLNLDIYMYPKSSTDSDLPKNANDFFSSKEIGEPPLILAATVFFVVKDAARAYREETNQDTLFELTAPATVQDVHRACGKTV
eukprot:scaffold44703_cov64-Attheya_sp.AAC.2